MQYYSRYPGRTLSSDNPTTDCYQHKLFEIHYLFISYMFLKNIFQFLLKKE